MHVMHCKEASLYYLKINDGELYKIGISSNLNRRVYYLKKHTMEDMEVVWQFRNTPEVCSTYEAMVLRRAMDYRVRRYWSTELFNKNIFSVIPRELKDVRHALRESLEWLVREEIAKIPIVMPEPLPKEEPLIVVP